LWTGGATTGSDSLWSPTSQQPSRPGVRRRPR
jgi:hypothetical protein